MQGNRARYRGNHHPAVREDILRLMKQDSLLGDIALARIGQLVRGECSGRALEARVGQPDLSDCRVLRFDTQEDDPGWRNITAVTGAHLPARDRTEAAAPPPRYCILYRLQDPGEEADRSLYLQVLAVAASVEAAVYHLAGQRLNRPKVMRPPRQSARPSTGVAGTQARVSASEQALREATRQAPAQQAQGHI